MALPLISATSRILPAVVRPKSFPHSTPAMGTSRPRTGCGGAPGMFPPVIEETTVRPPGAHPAHHTGILTAGAVSGGAS